MFELRYSSFTTIVEGGQENFVTAS
jgi:hypothetical protein